MPDGIEVIESAAVAALVAKTLPNAPTVKATQVGTTDVVQVTARSKNAQLAATAANAYAQAYIRYEQQQTTDTFTSAQAQVQNKIDTLQLAIATLNSQIRSAPATTNVSPEESQLGNLQGELTTLQNEIPELPVLCLAGRHHRGRSGHLDGDGARQTRVPQDAGVDRAGADLRSHPRHRGCVAGERPPATAQGLTPQGMTRRV